MKMASRLRMYISESGLAAHGPFRSRFILINLKTIKPFQEITEE